MNRLLGVVGVPAILLAAMVLHVPLRLLGRKGCFSVDATGLGIDVDRKAFSPAVKGRWGR